VDWLKIEMSGPDTQGAVTFGTTMDTLRKGHSDGADFVAHIAEDTLSATHFSHQIEELCRRIRDPVVLHALLLQVKEMYGRDPSVLPVLFVSKARCTPYQWQQRGIPLLRRHLVAARP